MLVSTLLDFNYTASCRSSNILGLRRKPVDIINLARNIAKQGGEHYYWRCGSTGKSGNKNPHRPVVAERSPLQLNHLKTGLNS